MVQAIANWNVSAAKRAHGWRPIARPKCASPCATKTTSSGAAAMPRSRTMRRRQWFEACRDKGYTVPAWPKEYGGAGLTPPQAKVLREEMARINARAPLSSFGIWMLGPALLKFGTEAQKQRFLNEIARGEIRWCQGYSEPGSGSDLVSLQTFGEDKGDHWVVNGQKIWTSYADKADWIFCLVRTDKADKYRGITFMLFDMASKGVSTKPILLISGNSPFCETFFDDVSVPKSYGEGIPAQVGEVNRGWDVAKYLLGHEREMISGADGGERTSAIGAALTRANGESIRCCAPSWPSSTSTRWPMPAWARSSSTRSRWARRIRRSPT